MLVGTAIGILLCGSRRLDVFFDGWLVLGLNIPALVTIILCYVWFGPERRGRRARGRRQQDSVTVVVTVREGARAIDRAARGRDGVRVPPLRQLTRVYLPQLLPYLFASARFRAVADLEDRAGGRAARAAERHRLPAQRLFQFFDIAGILAYTLAFAAVVLAVGPQAAAAAGRRLLRWRA